MGTVIGDKLPIVRKGKKIFDFAWESLVLSFDRLYYANKDFRRVFGRGMNLDSPVNLVEKFYWLECHSDLTLMAKCTDKYAVRDYVQEKGCGNILNKLYAVWSSPDDISLSALPDSFVLKINNGSGDVIIVKDKSFVSEEKIKERFRELFRRQYGQKNAQFHYALIPPIIIAEKLLPSGNNFVGESLVDYKIWCFNGHPECIWVAYNRSSDCVYMDLYDVNWNSMSDKLKPDNHYQYHPEVIIPRPTTLDQMLSYASLLSSGFPEVRVDFYECDEKVIFGEMTFTSHFGYFTNDFYDYLGCLTDLDLVEKIH
ncbi:MAG: hypothetical protein IJK05_04760 [Bacteroidales bacterium]|nr:hypothetical protein [Bacteroidales bacterium]